MLNIFAIFSLLLAPIDGVIPLIFQSVHRFLFVSISIYKECMFISQVSLFEWFEGGSLKKTCSDPPVLAWTRLPLMFSFGLVCLSCFCLGFFGFYFLLCASYSLLCHPSITGQSQCWCMYRFGQSVMNFELFSLCFLPPTPFFLKS